MLRYMLKQRKSEEGVDSKNNVHAWRLLGSLYPKSAPDYSPTESKLGKTE